MISQKAIDQKIKFVNNTIEKIKCGTACESEISKACDTVYWLWKWKCIDRKKSGELADAITDALNK